jgi:Protein of unknown function (DUF3300)
MKLGKALLVPSCFAACLMAQACVEYVPENGAAPAPPPPGSAQPPETPPPPPTPPTTPPPPQPTAQENSLDALLAPIALYPDPLIALILPASTAPGDISAASAYLIQYGDSTQIESQPWDPSVRALAHYPAVVTWMADNMAWTQALGAAFLASPSDVMASIQRLRERAMVSGALAPSAQDQVVSDDGDIEIIPSQPDAICIPYYDADSVYEDGPYAGPPITYGPLWPAGIWLSYYVDWHHRSVWQAGPRSARGTGGWYDPRLNGGRPPEGARAWHSPSGPPSSGAARATSIPRPHPMPGTPSPAPRQPREAGAQSGPQRGETRLQQPMAAPSSGRAPLPSESSHVSGTPAHEEPAHHAAPAAAAPAAAAPADSKDRDPGK